MKTLKFYIVRSSKSDEVVDGLRKIGLSCVNNPEVHGFIWLNEEDEMMQAQFLFEDICLEWEEQRGYRCGSTNRSIVQWEGAFHQQGSMIFEGENDMEQLNRYLELLKTAEFPEIFDQPIRKKILNDPSV